MDILVFDHWIISVRSWFRDSRAFSSHLDTRVRPDFMKLSIFKRIHFPFFPDFMNKIVHFLSDLLLSQQLWRLVSNRMSVTAVLMWHEGDHEAFGLSSGAELAQKDPLWPWMKGYIHEDHQTLAVLQRKVLLTSSQHWRKTTEKWKP